MTGVTSPPSIATAMAMLALGKSSICSSCQVAFTSGTARSAFATAITIMSLTETFALWLPGES